jgi:hypothetical protein
MRYKNEQNGCDIYVGMNALKATAFTRTKYDVLAYAISAPTTMAPRLSSPSRNPRSCRP